MAPSPQPYVLAASYMKGACYAAYISVRPILPGEAKKTVERDGPGWLLSDYSASGEMLGLEILDPASATDDAVNAVFLDEGLLPIETGYLRPLRTVVADQEDHTVESLLPLAEPVSA